MTKIIITIISSLVFNGLCFAQGQPVPIEENDRISYSLGFQIGGDLKQQGNDINPEALLKGLEDALAAAEPQLNKDEMQSILQDMKHKIKKEQRSRTQAAIEKYHKEDIAFLTANAQKEGVVVLPSGVQYEIIKKGTGNKVNANDNVTVHYIGTLFNGKEFYSTRRKNKKPETFHVSGVVIGMSEALQLMSEGDRWKVYIPAELAYGNRGPAAERAVSFDIEVLSTKPTE